MIKKTFYIFTDGELKRKDNTLQFITEEDKKTIPVEVVDSIAVFSEVSLNKRLLEFLSQKQIPLHFFNRYGYYQGTYYPREYMNSGYIILKQAEYFLDHEKRMFIAKSFVEGSLRNMMFILRTYSSRGKDFGGSIEELEKLRDEAWSSQNIGELTSIEGRAREIYYSCFDTITNNPDFSFEVRTRRPPANRMNALISFGNSLLYVTVLSEIYRTHLDPRIGYLHETNMRSFTLNLDIAEIFKPLIVDRVIFSLINRSEIKKGDFMEELGGIYLKERGNKKFINAFENRLRETITHKKLGRKVSYRRLIRLECYKLIKHFLGDETYSPYVMTR